MKTIPDLMTKDIHTAFVSLWRLLTNDYPCFQKAEQASLNDEIQHAEVKQNVLDSLVEKESLKIRNCNDAFPLALLEAMDQYLFTRYGARYDAPSSQVKLEGQTCLIHRRVRNNHEAIRHVGQTGHIRKYMRHHWIIPENISGFAVSIKKTSIAAFDPNAFSGKEAARIYVRGFQDDVAPVWDKAHLPDFLATGLSDKEKRWEEIDQFLNEAAGDKAEIVVFPELTVCPELRERISEWLDNHPHSFCFVLPGTFHQGVNGEHYNYGQLFGPKGKPALSHRKLTRFGAPGKSEKISTGNRIDLLDTPIGLMGMPICLDFCEEAPPFADLWQKIGADWLLVPACGGKTSLSAHQKRAEALNRAHGAVTVLSNQLDAADPNHEHGHGFICYEGRPETVSNIKCCISLKI